MATCNKNCKPIGQAQIGISFIVGCIPCPRFPEDARMSCSPGKVALYKKKFQRLGIRI